MDLAAVGELKAGTGARPPGALIRSPSTRTHTPTNRPACYTSFSGEAASHCLEAFCSSLGRHTDICFIRAARSPARSSGSCQMDLQNDRCSGAPRDDG